jgi:hypothetical protein
VSTAPCKSRYQDSDDLDGPDGDALVARVVALAAAQTLEPFGRESARALRCPAGTPGLLDEGADCAHLEAGDPPLFPRFRCLLEEIFPIHRSRDQELLGRHYAAER